MKAILLRKRQIYISFLGTVERKSLLWEQLMERNQLQVNYCLILALSHCVSLLSDGQTAAPIFWLVAALEGSHLLDYPQDQKRGESESWSDSDIISVM